MSEGKVGPALITSILMEAGKPMTTRELQEEVHKHVSFCISDSVVALNLLRLSGAIKGKHDENGSMLWWVENKGTEGGDQDR